MGNIPVYLDNSDHLESFLVHIDAFYNNFWVYDPHALLYK